MKLPKHIRLVPTDNLKREAWLELRDPFIGGSDVAKIMMLDPNCSRLKFYHTKTGEWAVDRSDGPDLYAGRVCEDLIAEKFWAHHDGETNDSIHQNAGNGIVTRTSEPFHFIAVNQKYPFAAVNIDRSILTVHGQKRKGPLEIKALRQMALARWKNRINPCHVVQLLYYMAVLECDYAELCLWIDGKVTEILVFERDSETEARIKSMMDLASDFFDRIERGRGMMRKYLRCKELHDLAGAEKYKHQMSKNAPPVEETRAFRNYMNERYLDELDHTIQLHDGNRFVYDLAVQYAQAMEVQKAQQDIKDACAAHIQEYMQQARRFDLGNNDYISWARTSRSVKRVFKVVMRSLNIGDEE